MIDWLFVVFILLAFIASLTPTRAKLPSGVFEIILGVILVSVLAVFGLNVNTSNHGGVAFLASFGSLALVFLAGAQSRTTTVRNAVKGENVKILVISILSFALPFIVTFLFSSLLLKWDTFASLLVATALSETSVAVVFVSLVETKLADTNFGKRVLKITFVTNLFTASALSALIFTREPFSIHFVIIFLLLFVALFTLPKVIKPILKLDPLFSTQGRLSQPGEKLILLLILSFALYSQFGQIAAVLPVHILGYILGPSLYTSEGKLTLSLERIRFLTFTLLGPIFFIYDGSLVSPSVVYYAAPIIVVLFALKFIPKFLSTKLLLAAWFKGETRGNKATAAWLSYAPWLLSTGLTWGSVAALVGLQANLINQEQFSILVTAIILSAVLPLLFSRVSGSKMPRVKAMSQPAGAMRAGFEKWTATAFRRV